MDWSHTRANKFSKDRPEEWPPDVQGISLTGLNLLGINQRTGKLYWDGAEIVTKNLFQFQTYERVIATFALLVAAGGLLLNVGKSAGWWP
jgi:hypothetical protein